MPTAKKANPPAPGIRQNPRLGYVLALAAAVIWVLSAFSQNSYMPTESTL